MLLWFQMCEDPFRQFFKLDALKSSEADGDQALDPSTEADEAPQTSGEQSATDESILTLMVRPFPIFFPRKPFVM
jgi:hypothetical protein